MIRVHGQSILNLIKEHEDSQQICAKLSLCSANNFLVQLKNQSTIKSKGHK